VNPPSRRFRTTVGVLELGERPWLMGVVNATPDSFSDHPGRKSVRQQVRLARTLLDGGADLIDVGGESGITTRPAITAAEEIERVTALISEIVEELGATVSVDTYKPEVARAAIAAGASMVNDVSGLLDPELADVCARTGAGLVVMHTRVAPKQKRFDRGLDGRALADVQAFLRERIALAQQRGVEFEQLMIDPGPDFGKTPAQTVEVLRGLETLHDLGRPLLLAVSRKDFIGAITGRPPRGRLAGTLAAIGHGVRAGAHVLRVHDVAEVSDYLAVSAALEGARPVDPALLLADELRREP
jgi:dihydropteroate synthase